jgi:ADP-ribose pyrophosphatase YjhB (NUDIX family)
MRDAILRNLYRVAYWVLWAGGPAVRRRGRGTKCLLTNDGQVLLVRHTYGPRQWDLPGGGLRRGEDPVAGIKRELREELGIEIEHAMLLGTRPAPSRPPGPVSYFSAELPDRVVRPDAVEIAEVGWWDPAAPPARLGMHAARMLARHGDPLASRASDPGSPARG